MAINCHKETANLFVDLHVTAPALETSDFLKNQHEHLIVDVRSPVEYQKGHITGAVNVPLFENDERSIIGILYKQQGKEKAIEKGFELVNPKKTDFLNQIKQLTDFKKIHVYCFRGGMRSNSFAWFLNNNGFDAVILKGGYKAFRNYALDYFTIPKKIILIGGKTGCMKTVYLNLLKQSGYSTLDIEQLANHKGSAFGNINEKPQEPQQIFENKLFSQLALNSNRDYLIMEDESQTLGYNKIPHALWLQMKKAPIIKIDMPTELRLNHLVKEYTTTNKENLINGINRISQQLGPVSTKNCINYVNEGNLYKAAELCLNYYDRTYDFKYDKKKNDTIVDEIFMHSSDINENYYLLKKKIDQLIK